MWIEELKDGRFKYFERYTDPYTGKYRRTSTILTSKSSRAQKQAKNILDDKIDKLLAKAAASDAYFTDVLQEWWKLHQKDLKASTVRYQTSYVNQLIDNFGVGVHIANIDTLYTQRYFDSLPSFKYKHKHLKGILRQCFDYAIDMNFIKENPITRVRLPKQKQTLEELQQINQKYLEEDELRRLLAELYSNSRTYRVALMAEFLSLSGLRFGEAVALELDDINLEKKTLRVNGTYSIHGHNKTSPKTLSSYRTIYMTNREIEIIQELQETNKLYANTKPNFKTSNFIFVSKNGNPMSINGFNDTIKNANTRLTDPINKKLTSHIFRHTLVSRLATHNVPLKAIMEKVGHSNPETTNRIYTHVTKGMQSSLIEILEKY